MGRQVLGADTLDGENLLNNLGVTQSNLGRHEEAERTYARHMTATGRCSASATGAPINVARKCRSRVSAAAAVFRGVTWMDRAIAAVDTSESRQDPGRAASTFLMRAQRAHVLFRLNQRREALAQLEAVVENLQRLPPRAAARGLAWSRVLLGRMLNETARPGDAEPMLAAALRESEQPRPAHPQRAEAAREPARARLLQHPATRRRRLRSACRLPILGPGRTSGRASLEVCQRRPF